MTNPEHWPYAYASLKDICEKAGRGLVAHIKDTGWIPEADDETNDLSRAKIVAMRREKGKAFLIKFNLYGDERKKREPICVEWTGEMVHNFGCAAVVSVWDNNLIDLIYERDTAPYTNTTDDGKRLDAINKRLSEIGGLHLFWS